MTFAELKSAFADRGSDDYTDAQRGARINAARAELDRIELWPWLETSVTGVAPIQIADLGTIEAVTNQSKGDSQLARLDYQTLTRYFDDLAVSGTPSFYYRASPSGIPAVATYPTNGDTIGVQYWKVSVDLSAAGDEPISPAEAHPTIVDLAVRRGYRDKDNHEAARELQEEIDRAIGQLVLQYPPGVPDGAYLLHLSD